jgi:hypothetical protein
MSYLVKLVRDKSNGRILLTNAQARVLHDYLFEDGPYLLNTSHELDTIIHELDDLIMRRSTIRSINLLIDHYSRKLWLHHHPVLRKRKVYRIPTEEQLEQEIA